MCGICGIHGMPNGKAIKKMCASMAHRGPDDDGAYSDEDIALGMTRLKIIDLSPLGHQPMGNEDGTIQLVFNGEIYNYKELRKRLEEKGRRFKSQSDTETIIHAYEEWGEDCLNELRGMFAFALWDKKEKNFSWQGIGLVLNRCIIQKMKKVLFLLQKLKPS